MMTTEITKDQAAALAALIGALRPDWAERGVLAKLAECRTRGGAYDIAHAALYAAEDATNRTPAVVPLAGAHWTRGKPVGEAEQLRAPRCQIVGHGSYLATNCGACRSEQLALDDRQATQRETLRRQGVPADRIRQILAAARADADA